jgi:phosphatidyl-myo-inositol alpha-mannosyltransferase
MKVALVAPYDLSVPGGVNSQIRGQARALARLGHDAQIFGPASGPVAEGEHALGTTISVTLGGTESGLGVDPRAFTAVERLLDDGFDVIHVHEPLTPLVPWIVLGRARVPVVGTFHVHREEGHRLYAMSGWMLRPLFDKLRARMAVSELAKRTVAEHFPADYDLVPNGVDVDALRAPRPRPESIPAERPIVLYVGRLEARKGVDVLVRAMARVRASVADALLVVAGDGSDRASLEALALETNAPVTFAGRVADENLAAYVQAAEIVCSPALGGESFGIVLLEGMAAGKPIVASRIAGYEALVGAARCARLVPPKDDAALAAEIVTLLRSPGLRRQLGDAGAAAARRYDWSTIGPALEQIYRRVLDGVRAPAMSST